MTRITIIGGGIIGLASAMALTNDGHVVTVVDDDPDRAAASWGNAGHLAIEQVAPLASLASIRSACTRRFATGGAIDLPLAQARHWLPFLSGFVRSSSPARFAAGRRTLSALLAGALPAWHDLAAALGDPAMVRADGHYVVWETPRTAAKGTAAWGKADIGTAIVRDTSDAERAVIASLTTRPIAGAVRFEGSGQIADLGRLASVLDAALVARGGHIVRRAAALTVVDGRAVVPGIESDLVLLAAGVRSGGLIASAGYKVPLIAERGYHIRAAADGWPEGMPPIVFEDRSMIVTRYADTVQAASFIEFADPDAPPDPRKWARLEAHVLALGLPLHGPFQRWMGARPTLPDYLPAIGRSRRVGNLLYAFGHQHLGLTLAPVTARIVAALARGDRPDVDIEPLSIERFGRRGLRP